MSDKIIQICPCEPDVRIAYDNEGLLEIYPPTCLAIIERCSTREIVYMETVDNEIKVVDTKDKNPPASTVGNDWFFAEETPNDKILVAPFGMGEAEVFEIPLNDMLVCW